MYQRPHTQIGQRGKGKNRPRRPRGPGAGGGQSIKPPTPPFGPSPGVGGMPQYPQAPPAFLPMTPGFEGAQRGANDMLTGAEGQYAMGRIMTPAQLGLQKQRLDTDMGVATDRMREDLAGRGVFTAKNAAGTYGGTSPAGGGIGESLYGRHIATPFGRQYQDLAAQGAESYAGQAGDYAGAQLGYNQAMFDALLGRASDAFEAMPTNLPLGGYNVPDQLGQSFTFAPEKPFGRVRPRKNQRRGNRPRGRR